MRRSPARARLHLSGLVVAALGLATTSGSAVAAPLPVPPSVQRALERLRTARGPELYAAIRGAWRQWDQTDPTFLEEAILEVEHAQAVPPAVRAYAGIVGAYARRRRGDLDGARAKIHASGVVDRWITVGPFDNEGKEGLARPFGPEKDLGEPLTTTRAYEGKERPVHHRITPDVYGFGWLDFGDLVRPQEKVCGYATTFVRAKDAGKAGREASLWLGATGAYTAFWNGAPVLGDTAYRQIDADRSAATVHVAPGWNRLTVKVCADDDAPMLAVRLGDASGAPDPRLESSNDVEVAAAEAARAFAPRAERLRGVEGPVQAFARATSGKKASPAALEAHARYLALTAGDDPAERLARSLARRAADAEPTVARALLAGELAEDRNQRRAWVERAAKLAGARPRVDVLLAQAQLARTGPSWRDAIPFFDQVLALEPGNVPALLGRVELANEAGLKRTALATLAKAVEASPSSIALLRVYAAALRQLDRSSEAAEAEERYASLRFDDATYLADRIDLALARRDAPAAERWIDRLLASEPDSAFALGSVARAYRALGQPGRALAAWEHALALAPEDVDVLRQLADLHAAAGRPEAQLALLRKILELRPQAKEVREYVDHVEPPRARKDETWAWEPDRFLARRDAAAAGHTRRTLRDLHVTTVFANGLASRFHQIVFQPLTDEAAAAAREYAFGYQADSETVQLRAAKVYRKDGKVDEAIESGESPADDPALATYTSARTFYVHFPRLGAGDVVELRYRIDDVTPRNDFADAFGEIAYLQSTEPVLSSEYVLRAPKGRRFTLFVSPLEGVTREERDEDDLRVIDVHAQDVPPIAVEPSMAPLTEVLAHVHAETWGSWDDVARFYAGLSKDAFVADDEVRARVAKLTAGLDDPAAKVRAVYGWVVQRTRYVALEFGIYGFKPRRAAQTLARGWGDCKDKATLIVTMLREAGIDAQIVLVRTGMRGGFETAPPGLAPFDHAIAYVPSLDLFLDGTAEYTGSTELPSMDRGALALVVDAAGTGKLVHLPDPPADATRRTRRVEATLAPDGSAQVELHLQTTGAHASEWRQRYHSPATRRERVAEDLAGDIPGFALAPGASAVDMNDLEDIEQAPRLRALGRVTAFARREGADLSIPVGPGERLVPAYAALSQRARDVRLRQRSTVEDELVLKLPAGVEVKSAPAPARLETPFGTATLEVERAGGKVTVKTKLVLSVSRIAAADYPAWRAFCEDVDRTFAQRLVVGGAK